MKKILFASLTFILLAPQLALAAEASTGIPLINPLGRVTDPRVIIGNIITAVLSIVGSLALLMFVYGGVLWITSAGKDKQIQKGKDILTWSVAGLAIIAASYAVVNAVFSALTTGSVNG